MGCLDYKNCKNYLKECEKCSKWYVNKFEQIEIKDDECQCICCKKIFHKDKIFRYKDNLKKGLCFNCY